MVTSGEGGPRMGEVICDMCFDEFSPVEYTAVNHIAPNFCSEACERKWGCYED